LWGGSPIHNHIQSGRSLSSATLSTPASLLAFSTQLFYIRQKFKRDGHAAEKSVFCLHRFIPVRRISIPVAAGKGLLRVSSTRTGVLSICTRPMLRSGRRRPGMPSGGRRTGSLQRVDRLMRSVVPDDRDPRVRRMGPGRSGTGFRHNRTNRLSQAQVSGISLRT